MAGKKLGHPDLKEYHTRGRKCTHCGKRGRAKCQAGVCLNFCCMTKFFADKDKAEALLRGK